MWSSQPLHPDEMMSDSVTNPCNLINPMTGRTPRQKYQSKVHPYSRELALIVLCKLMSIGHVKAGTVDTAQMFPEGFPVLKGIWALPTAIQPNPRAEEPRVGVGYSNMAVGHIFVSTLPPTACCMTIVIFGGSAPFHWLEVFTLRM